jgi:ribosome-binding protein aMBF1 (putative translation factor)
MNHLLENRDTETIILRKNPKKKNFAQGSGTKKNIGNNKDNDERAHIAKVERNIDEGIINLPKIPLSFRLEMQKARSRLNMTQAELAKRINEPVEIIKKYENGTVIPVGKVLGKIKKSLGITGK